MSKPFVWVLVASLFSWAVPAGAAEAKSFERSVPLAANGRVAIHTFKGSVEVTAWDEPRAQIVARIEPDESCGDPAERRKRVELTEVEIDATPSELSIRSDYDKLKDLDPIRLEIGGEDWICSAYPLVHYRIRMPRTARLEIEDHKSKTGVTGLRSEARIRTHKGIVDVKEHDGSLDLETHKGEARVEFARLSGDSRLKTYKGDLEVALPKSAGFDLEARVERGSFDSEFEAASRAVGRRERIYEEKVNGGGPLLALSTRGGSLRITGR